MKYKIVIIEDNQRTYHKIAAKIDSKNFELLGFYIEPDITEFQSYIDTLALNQGDIYIVDWQLPFADMEYSPEDIFKALEQRKFNFLSKYWIFYSGPEGNTVAEFLRNYFPNKSYYDMPGKGNLEGEITKSDKNHFKDAIQDAVNFLDKRLVPGELQAIEVSNNRITIREFAGSCYDADDSNILISNGATVFHAYNELFLCMAYNSKCGMFLHFDPESKKLKKHILRFNDSSTKVKELLGVSMVDDNRKGFIYNPIFFDNDKQILGDIVDYVNIGLENLKISYNIKNRHKLNLERQIEILQEHGMLTYP